MRQTFAEAEAALEKVREKNRHVRETRRAEVYKKDPRIGEIDRMVRRIGFESLSAVRSGVPAHEVTPALKKQMRALREEKLKLLREAGFSANYLDEVFDCKACRDKGVVDNSYCKCHKNIVRRITYKLSGLDQIKLQGFDQFNIGFYDEAVVEDGVSALQNAKFFLKKALDFTKGNLLFYGSTGLGKTFLSGCIAKTWIEQGKLVCYMSAPRLFAMLDDNKFGRDTSARMKRCIEMVYDSDLLIIDDLGSEFRSAFVDTHLFDIINARLVNERSTIINTNMDMDELKKAYSERISSRIIGEYGIIRFFGGDIRMKKKLMNRSKR